MNIVGIVAGLAAFLAPAALAAAGGHADRLASVATYKPMAAFNHVIEGVRFNGYFLAGPERCEVTLFQTRVDDESLTSTPRRLVLPIAAGDRSEIGVDPDHALAIACTADADAIKIAPQVAFSAGL
jgi:hypothetical protein